MKKRPNKPKTKKSGKMAMIKKHLKGDMKTFDKEKKEDKELLGKLSKRFMKGK